jgi:hypothetical protein
MVQLKAFLNVMIKLPHPLTLGYAKVFNLLGG